jgi:hypothetical protein
MATFAAGSCGLYIVCFGPLLVLFPLPVPVAVGRPPVLRFVVVAFFVVPVSAGAVAEPVFAGAAVPVG